MIAEQERPLPNAAGSDPNGRRKGQWPARMRREHGASLRHDL
ncbi:hypothetical protein [Lawsonibacter hominis]|nr:hypothetical protein [Lawsonibacter hominis]